MTHIMIAGDTLEQYLKQLSSSPDSFRPSNCPNCSKGGLWHHGCYRRYPDRTTAEHKALNPVPILRFQMSPLRQDMLKEKGVASCFAHLDQTVIQKAMRLFRPAFQCIYGSGKYHAGMSGRMSPRSFFDYNGQASSDIGAFLIR